MKNQISLTILGLLTFLGVNAQTNNKDTEQPKYLKVECLNENNETNFMTWIKVKDGTHLDCEKEGGHLGYAANALYVLR